MTLLISLFCNCLPRMVCFTNSIQVEDPLLLVHHSFICDYTFVSRRGCHILMCTFFYVQKICISSIEMVCYWTVLALWENDQGKTSWTLPMEYGYNWCTRCNGRLRFIYLVDPCYCKFVIKHLKSTVGCGLVVNEVVENTGFQVQIPKAKTLGNFFLSA